MTIAPDVLPMLRQLLTDPGLRLDERPPAMPPPTVATIREMDINIDQGTGIIDILYTAANYEVEIQNYTTLNELLRRLALDQIPLNDDPFPKHPFKSALSLMNKTYCYVIFKLTNKNWQFSNDKDPFSLGIDSIFPNVYFAPRKVDSQGNIIPRGLFKDDCKIAYFIADGATAYEDSNVYIDPFNFHFDLVVFDSDGERATIPIVVDPDIRYPGGSGNP